jgi:hypothetical protein
MTASLIGVGPTLRLGGAITLVVVGVGAWRPRMLLNLNPQTLARPIEPDPSELEAAVDDPLIEIT